MVNPPAYRGNQPPPGHGTTSDRFWAVLSHLSLVLVVGLVLPLVVVLVKGHKSPFVCHHAVEALNFQTTVLLAVFACSLLNVAGTGLVLLLVVLLGAGAMSVVAAAQAYRGAWHRYSLALRLVP